MHRPRCKLEEWWGCSLVVQSWADLQSLHGFCCYDNITPNAKCQRVLVLALCLVEVVSADHTLVWSWISRLPHWFSSFICSKPVHHPSQERERFSYSLHTVSPWLPTMSRLIPSASDSFCFHHSTVLVQVTGICIKDVTYCHYSIFYSMFYTVPVPLTLPYLRGGWVLATHRWGHNRIVQMCIPEITARLLEPLWGSGEHH